jgi:ribonuclease J
LEDRRTVEQGPFSVTPFLADHSAFDSYSLLVEADGRRLFYTGDLRGHGRKSGTFKSLLREPPQAIDVALLEGTQVGRPPVRDPMPPQDESELEIAMAESFRQTPGLALVYSSAQNLDRLVTVYRAAVRAGRMLVVDLYGATVAQASGRKTIPQPGFRDLRVYVPERQRILVKQSGQFERVSGLGPARIFVEEISDRGDSLVALLPGSTTAELARSGSLGGAKAIWSLWPGYLEQPSGKRLTALLEANDVPLDLLHVSGHATVEQLQELVSALSPTRVVPIHTKKPEQYPSLFPRVEIHADGEWWEV